MHIDETIDGYAKLIFQGVLVNGEYVSKYELPNVLIGADDIIVPLFSNEMDKQKYSSKLKIMSLQNYFTKQTNK